MSRRGGTPTAVRIAEQDWRPLHGDTEATDPIAVLRRSGAALDLTDWTIRAQIRDRDDQIVHTFVRDVGILVGSGTARVPGQDPVTTSTLRLRLHPADWPAIPRRLRGRFDVEVSRGGLVRTVLRGVFEPEEDTTR